MRILHARIMIPLHIMPPYFAPAELAPQTQSLRMPRLLTHVEIRQRRCAETVILGDRSTGIVRLCHISDAIFDTPVGAQTGGREVHAFGEAGGKLAEEGVIEVFVLQLGPVSYINV